jgi:hypothetical protein
MTAPRTRTLALATHERAHLEAALAPVAAAADLVPLTVADDPACEGLLDGLGAELAAALPTDVHAALLALADDELDCLIIDGEPERPDLPGTWEGVGRRFAGGLMADWLGLAYAHTLGARSGHDRAFDQLSLEAQLGSDGLHRDTLPYAPGDETKLPAALAAELTDPARPSARTWTPSYLACRYSSLACVRPGTNPDITTVVVHRAAWLEGELGPWLPRLAEPRYRCELLAEAGFTDPFPLVRPLAEGGWDLSVAAINSSLILEQRSHGARIRCEGAGATEAIARFDRARVELERYAEGVRWCAGRRLILNQRAVFHGRRGAVRSTTDEDWARERWIVRFNANPSRPSASPSITAPLDHPSTIAALRQADARCKRAWLRARAEPKSDAAWLAGLLRHSEW